MDKPQAKILRIKRTVQSPRLPAAPKSKPRAKVIRIERTSQAWKSVDGPPPPSGEDVLLSLVHNYSGTQFVVIAMYAAPHTLRAADWADPDSDDAIEYDAATNEEWLASGWYEANHCHTDYEHINGIPMAWQPLPKPCLKNFESR